ncbi:hypothetical protein EYF80_013805 [Liparis tanakae]|uniref:Uncharacterized protein n=1 Tax=Liparis tanakae TaxID=230148 RepID=A0A4Z2IFE6_9TELE|nr:hypothetical protein EYF80_013805 [Liparis tanakae]
MSELSCRLKIEKPTQREVDEEENWKDEEEEEDEDEKDEEEERLSPLMLDRPRCESVPPMIRSPCEGG